jgi:carboxypeptidase Q
MHQSVRALRVRFSIILLLFILGAQCALSQPGRPAIDSQVTDDVDSSAMALIIKEGTEHSKVMDLLSDITDVHGPRLTFSPGYRRAAEWARARLTALGAQNSRLEGWEPLGKSWELAHYSANVIGPQPFPLLSYPKAWSPAVSGRSDIVYLDAQSDSELDAFKGKLHGKYVLLGDPRALDLKPDPEVTRYSDTQLLDMANADIQRMRRRRRRMMEDNPDFAKHMAMEYRKLQMVYSEGALAILSPASFDGGSIGVMGATVPTAPDTPWANRIGSWNTRAPQVLPQIAVGVEHYNRLVRMLKKGTRLELDLQLGVQAAGVDSGYNVIAEIPGTDLKDEVVMLGAHLDSWHGGTGATDNGVGAAVCMEALRIIKTVGLHPRRTIRIALWGGEEEGLLGSRAFVRRYLGTIGASSKEGALPTTTLLPDAAKVSVYFNMDNGTGKFRGLYLDKNEAARPVFRRWFTPFGKEGAFTLTVTGTGSTDHVSFDAVGVPAFQFIQDEIEYFSRTWHSTMDVYDHALEDDLKQNAVIMAGFVFNAAMRDEMLPRK